MKLNPESTAQVFEPSSKIKIEAKLQRLQNSYIWKPPTLPSPKIPKIKVEPGVGSVDSIKSRFVVSEINGKMTLTKRIKLSPCYPVTASSLLSLPAVQKEETTNIKKEFECIYCFRRYERKTSLCRHLRLHNTKYRFKCVLCPSVFQYKAKLLKHKRAHSTEKQYRCIICNKGFNQKGHLRRHLRIHSGYRPYKCSRCPKAFTRATCLVGHVRTHTGERPWRCVQCPKAFTQSYNLRRHVRSHSGDRPYSCARCQKFFSQKGSLRRHMVRHHSSPQIAQKIESMPKPETDESTQPNWLRLGSYSYGNSKFPTAKLESTYNEMRFGNLKRSKLLKLKETKNIAELEEDNKSNCSLAFVKNETIPDEKPVGVYVL